MGGRGQGPPRDRATAKAGQGEALCRIDNSRLLYNWGRPLCPHLRKEGRIRTFAHSALGELEIDGVKEEGAGSGGRLVGGGRR